MSSPLASHLIKASAVVASVTLASTVLVAPAHAGKSEARLLRGDGCNHAVPHAAHRSSSVRVGTFNIRASVSAGTFAAGVNALLPNVDIAGLQEVNNKDKAMKLAAIKRSGTWSFWRQHRANIPKHPHEGGAEQTPVLWRSDRFVCTYAGPMFASGMMSLHGEGPSFDDNQRHWFTVVHLVDRITGQRLSIVDVHLIHGAIQAGRPVHGRPRHWDVYRVQMAHLIKKVEQQRGYGRVFIMGDFNAGWVADKKHRHKHLPFRSFRAIGYASMWATQHPHNGRGTHNDALIDQVYARQKAASAQVLFNLSGYSDHVPAVARYNLPAA